MSKNDKKRDLYNFKIGEKMELVVGDKNNPKKIQEILLNKKITECKRLLQREKNKKVKTTPKPTQKSKPKNQNQPQKNQKRKPIIKKNKLF